MLVALSGARPSPERDALRARLDPGAASEVPPAIRPVAPADPLALVLDRPADLRIAAETVDGVRFVRVETSGFRARIGLLRPLPDSPTPWIEVYSLIEAWNAAHGTRLRVLSHSRADWLLTRTGAASLLEGFGPFPCDTLLAYEAPGVPLGDEIVFRFEGQPALICPTGPAKGRKDVALVVEGLARSDFEVQDGEVRLGCVERLRVLDFPSRSGWFEADPGTRLPTGWPDAASLRGRKLLRATGPYVGPIARGVRFGGFPMDDLRQVLAGNFAWRDRYAVVVEDPDFTKEVSTPSSTR